MQPAPAGPHMVVGNLMAIDPFDAPRRKLLWGHHRTGEFAWLVKQYQDSNHGVSISATPDDTLTWDSLEFVVVFGDGVPPVFQGQPVIGSLSELADLVGGVIAAFAACPADPNV